MKEKDNVEAGALTEAEAKMVYRHMPAMTPGYALVELATDVARIKAEAVQAERERIAGAIRGHNWRATQGEGYQYCRGFWAGIDCAALIAQGEGR